MIPTESKIESKHSIYTKNPRCRLEFLLILRRPNTYQLSINPTYPILHHKPIIALSGGRAGPLRPSAQMADLL